MKMRNPLTMLVILVFCCIFGASAQPSCYDRADPCRPAYPCPVNVQTPHGVDCQSYYQCVTPYDWVALDNGCPVSHDFDVYQCTCALSGVNCSSVNDLCPYGVTTPPADHGISPEPCAAAGDCSVGSQDVPDEHTCSRYFTCTLGNWVSATCPEGQIFDPNLGGGCLRATPSNLDLCADNPCLQPTCYDVADPCRPDYPCPLGVKVPSGTDCQSYYQCVTPLDWVFLSNGCPGLYDFDVKQCMCDKDVTCSDIDELCPNGVTTPPTDPGISPEPCAPGAYCTPGSPAVPDVHTCSRYFTCPAGNWEPATCPEGQIFHQSAAECIVASDDNLSVCNEKLCEHTTGSPGVTADLYYTG